MAEEFKDINAEKPQEQENKPIRVRLPRGKEVIGIIEQRYGGNKMSVNCLDKKNRNCRVPGRLKRKLWLRPNDIVIIQPWELDNNKGDVLFKYRPNQIEWLKNKGYLKTEKTDF
ncbi:MAG: translation initiation factor eIF-1A [Nanoarchaeota archaeon]|nr:translation initiation factor eIF-1A [Nanoarchaeota archaeon]MBU1027635.1 translation initiation factor eIF-1A [Nanoarchaeota archaeon]